MIVGGATGEGQQMSWDEHIMHIGHTVNCFGGSIKVIGNTGSNSTRQAIHATEQALAQLGVMRPVFRLPYVPVPLEKRVAFVSLVKQIGKENFVGEKDVQVLDDLSWAKGGSFKG
ncbi:4-hydroxy-tetrahydrodipicolinate synthase [Melia azedarach]|uniref:4-hydroxy-tetrahydrodipicolinate synthase n=1 Tax=Melia azedarach TaxID=155640 RepID=A0ACC1YEG0_MELAZ|nr:4-hydroxy-tetrahydrodipicolinate synthase [Melia azedarach]